jgi:hypothetical protein
VGQAVGALPGRVVYLIPAVITVKSAAGEIAAGEALGAVGVAALESASIGGRYRGLGAGGEAVGNLWTSSPCDGRSLIGVRRS